MEFFGFYTDDPNIQEPTSQDDRASIPDDDKGIKSPRDGPKDLGDCYMELMHFDLEAIKKKSYNNARDTVVVADLVAKTSSFVQNTSIKFWNEISRLALEK